MEVLYYSLTFLGFVYLTAATRECKKNEKEIPCFNFECELRNCSQIGTAIKCAKYDTNKCIKGCICDDDYLRDDTTGICVPKSRCPPVCYGENEVVACENSCPQTCDSIGKIYHCPFEPSNCTLGCRCKENYYRNKFGECISKEDCAKQCNENEIYDSCPSLCPPQSCDVDERLIKCRQYPLPGSKDCVPGCRCIDNYKRNKFNICIPKEKCPPFTSIQCGSDEVYSSCVNGGCGRWNCSQTSEICYKLAEGACREGCHCKESFLRADNGTCIPANQCPSKPPPVTCGADEVYTNCVNGGCGRWNCSQEGLMCIDLVEGACVEGCHCKKPLLRADDGTCVPEELCSPCSSFPPSCPGENEILGCESNCPDTCESIYETCETNEPEICNLACVCKPGYYRNEDDECVTPEQCEYSCY